MPPDPSSDPSVFNEPHLRADARTSATCWHCGYARTTLGEKPCPECGAPVYRPASAPGRLLGNAGGGADGGSTGFSGGDGSVWDEPHLSKELAGEAPAHADTFWSWYTTRAAATTARTRAVAFLLIALASGPAAVGTALWQGLALGGGYLQPVLFGPCVEEVAKTAVIAFVVERAPHLMTRRLGIVLCGLVSGLIFAIIENFVYLHSYIEAPSPLLTTWRWTVCVLLHTACSTIAAMGLARAWKWGLTNKRRPRSTEGLPFLVAAIVIHSLYNLAMVIWESASKVF